MQSPTDNSLLSFVKIADFLAKLKLPLKVPKIFAKQDQLSTSYLLLSHLGDNLIFNNIDITNAETIYQLAWQTLVDLQVNATNINLAPMDRAYIKKNLAIFDQWYLKTHLKSTHDVSDLLLTLENYLVETFSNQPQAFVHVDYHSKNLLLDKKGLNILDFQDAMFGPITYDMASLLQDAYLVWPDQLVEKILLDYYDYINHNSCFNLQQLPKSLFIKSFYLTGLQRHLKNLGVFARLKYFYNKPNYIKYIPNLLYYIKKTCTKFSNSDQELLELQKALTIIGEK
jgi:hypothetical protein